MPTPMMGSPRKKLKPEYTRDSYSDVPLQPLNTLK
jgi:hypothetical protein